jgi:hypothetical protein
MPPRDRSCCPNIQEARREVFGTDFAAVRRPRPVFALRRSISFDASAFVRSGFNILMGFLRKSLQIRLLRPGYLLVAGNPIIRLLYAVRIFGEERLGSHG